MDIGRKMRLVFVVSFMLLLAVNCYSIIQMGVGFDFLGKQTIKSTDGYNTETTHYDAVVGASPLVEVLMGNRSGYYGFGIEYQIARTLKINNVKAKFGFIPVYGVVRVNLTNHNETKPAIIGQVGYNYFYGNEAYKDSGVLKGGPFIGIGVGVGDQNIFLQLMYKVNYGSYETEGMWGEVKSSVTNSQLNISGGVRL
jgi:hypothetical protein